MDSILIFSNLASPEDISVGRLFLNIHKQMKESDKTGPDAGRFKIHVEIYQGTQGPVKDLLDYLPPIVESMRQSNRFWAIDAQIDEITLKGRMPR